MFAISSWKSWPWSSLYDLRYISPYCTGPAEFLCTVKASLQCSFEYFHGMWVGSRFHSLETFKFQFGNNFTNQWIVFFKAFTDQGTLSCNSITESSKFSLNYNTSLREMLYNNLKTYKYDTLPLPLISYSNTYFPPFIFTLNLRFIF